MHNPSDYWFILPICIIIGVESSPQINFPYRFRKVPLNDTREQIIGSYGTKRTLTDLFANIIRRGAPGRPSPLFPYDELVHSQNPNEFYKLVDSDEDEKYEMPVNRQISSLPKKRIHWKLKHSDDRRRAFSMEPIETMERKAKPVISLTPHNVKRFPGDYELLAINPKMQGQLIKYPDLFKGLYLLDNMHPYRQDQAVNILQKVLRRKNSFSEFDLGNYYEMNPGSLKLKFIEKRGRMRPIVASRNEWKVEDYSRYWYSIFPRTVTANIRYLRNINQWA